MVSVPELIGLVVVGYVGWKAYAMVRGSGPSGARRERPVAGREARRLVHDPECNTYVPEESAERIKVGGQMIYFCSPECREAYLKKNQGDNG
jgi:YHS domain-containing protein